MQKDFDDFMDLIRSQENIDRRNEYVARMLEENGVPDTVSESIPAEARYTLYYYLREYHEWAGR